MLFRDIIPDNGRKPYPLLLGKGLGIAIVQTMIIQTGRQKNCNKRIPPGLFKLLDRNPVFGSPGDRP